MKIVFFGSTTYSVEILTVLLNKGLLPCLVVTQPDRPKGRGLKTGSTEVKEFSLKNRLKVITPRNLDDSELILQLSQMKPDLFIVVSYGKILPASIINIPKILTLGIHPSLLPAYRGAAPINWVLIKGERETGVSLFKIDEKMDAGEIIAQEKLVISNDDDFLTLSKKIYALSKKLLIEHLPLLDEGKFRLTPQKHQGLSFAPKIEKNITKIDWHCKASSIKNLVRGLVPYPCAWSYFREKRVKFWKVSYQAQEHKDSSSGQIVEASKHSFKIVATPGLIEPKLLQPEGKKVMSIDEFINGLHPKIGEQFS